MSGGTLPTVSVPAQVQIRSMQPTRTSSSHSLKDQSRTRGAQRFGFKFVWPPLKRADWAPLYGFFLSQRGQADTFTATIPGMTAPLGTWLGSPVVNGAGQTGRVVSLRGLTVSQAAAAKVGDLLKFAGHTKVYMVTADAASNVSGIASVTIEPALLAAVADAEAVTVNSVPFTFKRAADNFDSTMEVGGIYAGLEADLVESW